MDAQDFTLHKTCNKCQARKPATFEFFYKYGKYLRSECKDCIKAKSAQYRADNPEKTKAALKQWYDSNKEYVKAKRQDWLEKNQDYRKTYNDAYYKRNKQKFIDDKSRRAKIRRQQDPVFATASRIRTSIRSAIIRGGYTKRMKSMEILGCDWEFFKKHIERQFLKGMSWDRIKEIHIDHIIPMATAKTEEDVLRLNHYTNLRPMWAKDNISKSDKVLTLL